MPHHDSASCGWRLEPSCEGSWMRPEAAIVALMRLVH